MTDFTRAELYRMRQEEQRLRPAPWSPAMTFALTASEREWVCAMRQRVPALSDQVLTLLRERQSDRRRIADLESQVFDLTRPEAAA